MRADKDIHIFSLYMMAAWATCTLILHISSLTTCGLTSAMRSMAHVLGSHLRFALKHALLLATAS